MKAETNYQPLRLDTSTFEDLQKQINQIQKQWDEEYYFFVTEFTKKLRTVVYYQLNHMDFDGFYWYSYNNARQYLGFLVSAFDDNGKPVNVNSKLKKWIEDYKKEYPNLLPESQALLAEQYNKDYNAYTKFVK